MRRVITGSVYAFVKTRGQELHVRQSMVFDTVRVRPCHFSSLDPIRSLTECTKRRYRFPLELVSSVFDLVFAEGVEAIFRFSIAILKRNEKVIMELEFEHLLEFLKNGLFQAYAVSSSSHILALSSFERLLCLAQTLSKMNNAAIVWRLDHFLQPDPNEKGDSPLYKAHEFVKEALQIKITPLMLVRSQFSFHFLLPLLISFTNPLLIGIPYIHAGSVWWGMGKPHSATKCSYRRNWEPS